MILNKAQETMWDVVRKEIHSMYPEGSPERSVALAKEFEKVKALPTEVTLTIKLTDPRHLYRLVGYAVMATDGFNRDAWMLDLNEHGPGIFNRGLMAIFDDVVAEHNASEKVAA